MKNRGITLIALIITIIILLILAGISMSLIMGDNGILTRTKVTAIETRGATVEEQVTLWKADIEMSKHAGGIVETYEQIRDRLYHEKLLTEEDLKELAKPENINLEVTIGSRTISFKLGETGGITVKDPSKEIIGDGSFVNGVNTPKLATTMTPIVYDETVTIANGNIPAYWRKAENEKEWYSYKDTSLEGYNMSKWANAVTEDGSMWVWIPRYEYKIISGQGTATAGEIEVNFIPTTVNSKTGGITEGYRIHPAFENGSTTGKNNNFKNGEWDKELDGLWVAKFEASRSDSTVSNIGTSNSIKIQPNVKSWTNSTVGDSYTDSLNMLPSYNSHMMKNSEWGAVAYLTHSKYGKNKIEVKINSNTAVVTGGGNYISNFNQSTTGNQTGIYDLNGGSWERVAAYISNGNPALKTYASSVVGDNISADINGYQTKSSKTITVYPYNTSDSGANNWTAYKGLQSDNYAYGDAILETSANGGTNVSWYNDYSSFAYNSYPLLARGGRYNDSSYAGIFAFHYTDGAAASTNGFRLSLAF